ncbi:MAG: PAS domain S-box protein [Candidatus Zixiibacteriota bacterium]|nr:MAG: PAS domain S-box protein [candidate division Zixibacteria bacterium]
MKINKSKFQTGVHLGLLVIIFILLLMNFRSNLTIYHAGVAERRTVSVELNNAALSISRTIQKEDIGNLAKDQKQEFQEKHNLINLIFLSSHLPGESGGSTEFLLKQATDSMRSATGKADIVALKRSDLKQLIRAHDSEYYYLFPLSGGNRLLMLSRAAPELAYLEESSRTLILVNVVVVILIVVLYLLVFRIILSPFRKIKHQAMKAGRELAGGPDEVEALVDDYRQIVTELKEKEAQLLELNRSIQDKADRLELFNEYLLRSMSSGIIIFDASGRVLSVNRAAGQIIGVDAERCIGQRYDELPGFDAGVFETVRMMLDTDANQSYQEHKVRTTDGKELNLGVTVSSIHDYTSNRVGVSILINDLTEISNLRSEIEGRNRLAALGEMASGLAHQLRNSIGAMAGYAHLVKKRMVKSELETDSIVALEDETREAERLVDRFLSFARPFQFRAETTNVLELVKDVLETFRVRPENKHIRLQVENNLGENMSAKIDGLLVKQALANIIENAINAYDGSPGRIIVRLSVASGMFEIQIQDYGCGIDEEDRGKIFTPFFSSRPSGTGLGLPLAKKIIDLHQGRLTVDSKLGEGAMFTIYLPGERISESTPSPETSAQRL